MYKVDPRLHLDKIFLKLGKKNPKHLEIIYKKVKQIVKNPHRYKNLRSPLNNWKIQI